MGNKKGLRVQVTARINMIVAVLLIVLTTVACIVTTKNYTSQRKEIVQTKIGELDSRMNTWLNSKTAMIEYMADEIVDNGYIANRAESIKFLKDSIDRDDDVFECYVGLADKSSFFGNGWAPTIEEFDPTSRIWYKKAMEIDGAIITDPYTDLQTGKLVITCACALNRNGEKLGVIAMDMYLDSIVNLVNGFKIDESGYAILTTADKKIIVHPDSLYIPTIGADGKDVFSDFGALVKGYDSANAQMNGITIKDSYGEKVKYNETVNGMTNWILGYATPTSDYYSGVVHVIIFFVILTMLLSAVSTVIVIISMRGAFRPLNGVAKEADKVTKGILDVQFSYQYDDEIGALCRTIENNNHVVKGYIEDITARLEGIKKGKFKMKSKVEYIGDYAKLQKALDNITTELSDIFNGIDSASSAVFGGANGVSENANNISRTVSEQTSLINDIVSSISSVSERINANVVHTDNAKVIAKDTGEIINESSNQMEQLLKAMSDISSSSEKIKKIMDTIESIAFQTNILALNAAVEATKAGAAGSGFAVVAEEVRMLAAQSAQASEQTAILIQQSDEAVKSGLMYAKETADSLKKVVTQSSEIDNIILDINEESHEQRNYIDDVTSKINQIANYINSSVANVEESAAASERLNNQASVLKNMLKRFNLKTKN